LIHLIAFQVASMSENIKKSYKEERYTISAEFITAMVIKFPLLEVKNKIQDLLHWLNSPHYKANQIIHVESFVDMWLGIDEIDREKKSRMEN
jgi:hypothetical protein